MNSISVNYTLKYRFKDHHHIQVTNNGEVFNIKTGRRKKICYNGGSLGVWITPKKFIIKKKLNANLEKIPKYEYIKNDFLTNL